MRAVFAKGCSRRGRENGRAGRKEAVQQVGWRGSSSWLRRGLGAFFDFSCDPVERQRAGLQLTFALNRA